MFNIFIQKIDCHLAKNGGKTIEKRREQGEQCERQTPKDIPDWMKESNSAMDTADGGIMDESGSENELT